MKELRYGIHGEAVKIYHHVVLGLATLKQCPLLNEDDYATPKTMTEQWFNRIADWLCDNFPSEFKLK